MPIILDLKWSIQDSDYLIPALAGSNGLKPRFLIAGELFFNLTFLLDKFANNGLE